MSLSSIKHSILASNTGFFEIKFSTLKGLIGGQGLVTEVLRCNDVESKEMVRQTIF